MTVKLFWKDAYMKEFDSKVERVEGDSIVLQETAFYPTGGGVLNDTGTLAINAKEYNVTDVTKSGEEISHHVKGNVTAQPGDAAHGVLDWNRRYALMRLHTAVHLLDGIVEKQYQNGGVTGGTIFPDRARIDFAMDNLNRELVQKIVEQTNTIAKEGHTVSAKEMSSAEALAIPNLARTEPGKELIRSMSTVRVVEIEGVDAQADGGLHVANTTEIGQIVLGKYENKGRHSKRVEISVS